MADSQIFIRVNDSTLARIDALAAKLQRSRTWVIADMLQSTVDEYEEQVRLIEQRLQEVETGTVKLVPHNDLDRWMNLRSNVL